MKVLMFGWEFPPKILGGLAVASYGITKGLSLQGDVETTFCLPKPTGQEEKFLKIITHILVCARKCNETAHFTSEHIKVYIKSNIVKVIRFTVSK